LHRLILTGSSRFLVKPSKIQLHGGRRKELGTMQNSLVQEAQEKLRSTALSELDEAIRMIELLEEENLRVVVHVPASRPSVPPFTVIHSESHSDGSMSEFAVNEGVGPHQAN
jgi:hypothetical protein